MESQLSKNLMCIKMRSGVTIWVEKAKAEKLQTMLDGISSHKFIRYEEQTFNTADLEGVYSAHTMADHTRRKNGEYQCPKGTWHSRKQGCDCRAEIGFCKSCDTSPCTCDMMSDYAKNVNIKSI